MKINASVKSAAVVFGIMIGTTAMAPAQEIFEKLAAPGEKVELWTEAPEGGGEHYLRFLNNADGSINRFLGHGRVILRSPKLNLEADELVYEAAMGVLTATGRVQINRPGVKASSGKMVYDLDTQEIVLTEESEVFQETETNRTHFVGMEQFTLVQNEDGSTEVRLTGGEQIQCEMLPLEGAVQAESTPEGQQPDATKKESSGLGALGDNVRIISRPTNDKQASILVNTTTTGLFDLLRAEGSVVMRSDEMDLRANLLEYDAGADMVEALYNVYIKQGNIEADCGRMVYNLETDQITLSVSPIVREKRENAIMVASEMDAFIIERYPDGTSSTEFVGGPEGQPNISWESLPPALESNTANPEPEEIRIDSDEDLMRLTE